MSSTYSNLKIELMGTGEQSGLWGATTNQNLNAIQQAIGGQAAVSFATDADKTLTYTNTNTDQDFRAMYLNVTSAVSLTATRSLIVPAVNKVYIIKNATTGGQSLTVKIGSSTGISVPNGFTKTVYANGTDVVPVNPGDVILYDGQSTMSAPATSSYITNTTTVQSLTATNGVSAGGSGVLTTSVSILPQGYGAFMVSTPDDGITGGTGRGGYAVDLQRFRTVATQVARGDFSVICGGLKNTNWGYASVIGGGEQNAINTASIVCNYVFLGGGNQNIADGNYSAVVGGLSNQTLWSQQANFIGGGQTNSILSSNSVIGGGVNNSVSGVGTHNYSAIVGGYYGSTRTYGSRAFAAGSFSTTAGTAQEGQYVLRIQTTNATATRLTSDGGAASATNSVNLPNNSSFYVKGQVIARNTSTGDTKVWTFDGAIKRGANAAATALVAAITPTAGAADSGASAWTLAIAADTTNGGLSITGTGAAATTIRWVCTVSTVEVVNG